MPGSAWQNKAGNSRRTLTERNFTGYRRDRASRPEQFSRSGGDTAQHQKLSRANNQTHAKVLNRVMSKYMREPAWENAYEAVTVPDALSGYGQEIQAAFGRNIRFVAPTEERFTMFNGIYVPHPPNSVYSSAKKNLTPLSAMNCVPSGEAKYTHEQAKKELTSNFMCRPPGSAIQYLAVGRPAIQCRLRSVRGNRQWKSMVKSRL